MTEAMTSVRTTHPLAWERALITGGVLAGPVWVAVASRPVRRGARVR
ncbi:hypothetical protein [Micromonospora globispora]|nr:hypothetical protein [Micromonospora globispora]